MPQAAMKSTILPHLILGVEDHGKLTTMANGITGPMANVAGQLLKELNRARVVAQSKLPDDAVRLGSVVSFTTTDGFNRTFQLVFPGEADISVGKVSVLTPIGAALIGLREGQTIPWTTPNGRRLSLTAVRVEQSQ